MGKQDDKDESKRLEQNSFNMADQQRVRKKAAREKEKRKDDEKRRTSCKGNEAERKRETKEG